MEINEASKEFFELLTPPTDSTDVFYDDDGDLDQLESIFGGPPTGSASVSDEDEELGDLEEFAAEIGQLSLPTFCYDDADFLENLDQVEEMATLSNGCHSISTPEPPVNIPPTQQQTTTINCRPSTSASFSGGELASYQLRILDPNSNSVPIDSAIAPVANVQESSVKQLIRKRVLSKSKDPPSNSTTPSNTYQQAKRAKLISNPTIEPSTAHFSAASSNASVSQNSTSAVSAAQPSSASRSNLLGYFLCKSENTSNLLCVIRPEHPGGSLTYAKIPIIDESALNSFNSSAHCSSSPATSSGSESPRSSSAPFSNPSTLMDLQRGENAADASPHSSRSSGYDSDSSRSPDNGGQDKAPVPAPGKYNCKYCGKKNRDKTALDVHVRTHTKERPYPCTYVDWNLDMLGDFKPTPCTRAFIQKAHMIQHLKTHRPRNLR